MRGQEDEQQQQKVPFVPRTLIPQSQQEQGLVAVPPLRLARPTERSGAGPRDPVGSHTGTL